jgi:hypothetical protein
MGGPTQTAPWRLPLLEAAHFCRMAAPNAIQLRREAPDRIIGELKKHVRIGPDLRGEGQSPISDRAGAAQWHLSLRKKTSSQVPELDLVPDRCGIRVTEVAVSALAASSRGFDCCPPLERQQQQPAPTLDLFQGLSSVPRLFGLTRQSFTFPVMG